jgi:transposase
MSDGVNQGRSFAVLTAEPVLSRRKPRSWSQDEKARLISETLLPGANLSAVARAAGADPSQLYGWRRKALVSGAVAALPDAGPEEAKFARVETTETSSVEIVIGEAVVRVLSDIDPDHLTMILRAVRKA